MRSPHHIGIMLAASSMVACAAPALDGPRPKPKPKPTKEPLPQGEMTRQQRRAAEREQLKSPSRHDRNRKP